VIKYVSFIKRKIHFVFDRWVSTINGIICFVLFLPGIFVEHKNAGDDDVKKPIADAEKKPVQPLSAIKPSRRAIQLI
jgi:hypothetical protein